MADIVYAENSSLEMLKDEFKPENLQRNFEKRVLVEKEKMQKCSEDGFIIKSTLNDMKKNLHEKGLVKQTEEYEQKPLEELQAMLGKEKHTEDEQYILLQDYAKQLVLQADNKKEIADAASQIRETEKYADLSRNYGDDFSYLYQLRERVLTNEEFREDSENARHVQCHFNVVDVPENTGIMSQAEKFRQDALGGVAKTLVMEVQNEDEIPFNLAVKPFDELDNETKKKVQLSFSEENAQKLVSGSEEENKARIEKILKFCDDNGLSITDISFPKDRDGNIQIDEKLHSLMEQVQTKMNEENLQKLQEENKRREEELKQQGIEYSKDEENDLPPSASETSVVELENVKVPVAETSQQQAEDNFSEQTDRTRGAPATSPRRAPHVPTAEEVFIDMSENDLGRQDGKSYFRRKHNSWNVYVFYDKDVKYNKPVEQDKKGNIQYNYAFKLYFKTDEKGVLHVSYRTPNGRKVDQVYTDAIAGKLKDLNVTHFRIPKGWRADDVGTWRKSLAEKGIVPTGISLNKAKVESMLKAAKEKLSDEAYDTYKYRLGIQMEKYNREKGKHPDPSEQAYIQGLIDSRTYGAFIRGYNEVIKSKMRKNFRTQNGPDSAIDKIANFSALARLYAVYKANMNQADNIGIETLLNPEERRLALAEGVDLHANVKNLRQDQMGKLFDALQKSCKPAVEKKLDDALVLLYDPASVGRKKDTRPARTIINQILNDEKDACKGVIDDLLANGQDELKLVEAVGNLEYDYEGRHPAPATPRTATFRTSNSTTVKEDNVSTNNEHSRGQTAPTQTAPLRGGGRDSYS